MVNEAAAKTIPFPIHLAESSEIPEILEPKRAWLVRTGLRAGAIMTKPENPKGWGWNPAVVTLILVILGMASAIISLVAVGGYYVGQWDAERKFQIERLNAVEKKAESADTKATYAVSGADEKSGHKKEEPKEK